MDAFAKVYRLAGEVKEFEVSTYANIGEALKGLGIEVKEGEAVRINGEVEEGYASETIENGDVIVIVPQVKGGC